MTLSTTTDATFRRKRQAAPKDSTMQDAPIGEGYHEPDASVRDGPGFRANASEPFRSQDESNEYSPQ